MVHAALDTLLGVLGNILLPTLGKLLIAQKLGIHLVGDRTSRQSLGNHTTMGFLELTPFVEILVPVLARLIPFL